LQFIYGGLVSGYLITYFGPLAFVLAVTIGKEAWDDVHRWLRDREANKEKFLRLTRNGFEEITSADIRVGHIIQVTHFESFAVPFLLFGKPVLHDVVLDSNKSTRTCGFCVA